MARGVAISVLQYRICRLGLAGFLARTTRNVGIFGLLDQYHQLLQYLHQWKSPGLLLCASFDLFNFRYVFFLFSCCSTSISGSLLDFCSVPDLTPPTLTKTLHHRPNNNNAVHTRTVQLLVTRPIKNNAVHSGL